MNDNKKIDHAGQASKFIISAFALTMAIVTPLAIAHNEYGKLKKINDLSSEKTEIDLGSSYRKAVEAKNDVYVNSWHESLLRFNNNCFHLTENKWQLHALEYESQKYVAFKDIAKILKTHNLVDVPEILLSDNCSSIPEEQRINNLVSYTENWAEEIWGSEDFQGKLAPVKGKYISFMMN